MASRPVPVPEPEPEPSTGDTATALYDYDAAEANEISFPDGAIIENIVCYILTSDHLVVSNLYVQSYPDEDWWEGTYNGSRGLFVSITSINHCGIFPN